MTTKTKRPPMTATQAVSFDRISVASMMILGACLKCSCQPYSDVFTYHRWQAQGYQVRRGEKAIRLPLVKDVIKEDEETGEVIEVRRILGSSAVFCRCQVDRKKP